MNAVLLVLLIVFVLLTHHIILLFTCAVQNVCLKIKSSLLSFNHKCLCRSEAFLWDYGAKINNNMFYKEHI